MTLVEIALVLLVLLLLGAMLHAYFGSSQKALERVQEERPLTQARLTADRATLAAIRGALQVYHARQGRWPPDKDAVAALLSPPPRLQCSGNDFTYDPATGEVGLAIDDPARC